MKLVPRQDTGSGLFTAGLTLAALLVSLLLGALLLLGLGCDPLAVYRAILDTAFLGGLYSLGDTATKATPLILTGLACALTFRTGLWNVGAEGQLLVGAWAATGVASFWLPESTPGLVVLMALAAAATGALFAGIPGLLKARFGTSEILSSLMLVYVAIQWNNYWIYSPWSDRGFAMTPRFPRSAWLPPLSGLPGLEGLRGGAAHLGLIPALVLALLVWLLMFRTRLGFELKIQGSGPRTAEYAGIPVARNTVLVMMLSGALAGLAGMVEVSGVVHRLQESFSPGYGFTGILIAWLARLHPAGIVLASFLLGGLLVGAKEIQPAGIPSMLQGVILLTFIGFELARRYRLVPGSAAKGGGDHD